MNLFDGVELGSEWTPKDRETHGVITVVGRDGPHVVFKWGTSLLYDSKFPEYLFEWFNKVRTDSKLEQIDELRHQLNVTNLQLQKSEALRELLAQDFHGVKVALTESRSQVKNLRVMYDVSESRMNDLINERDSYQDVLSAIKAEASASFDSSLKRAVQHIMKGSTP